jgi:hypothetical protein
MRKLLLLSALAVSSIAAQPKLRAAIVDGVNNHDWAEGTRAIQTILEGTARFTVDVSTYPTLPDFSRYDASCDSRAGFGTARFSFLPEDRLEIESRNDLIRVRLNGQIVAEYPGEPRRPNAAAIGLQLHDQFTLALFRDIRIRPR